MQYIEVINQFGEVLVAQLKPLSLELAVWAGFIQLLIWGLRITSPALRHGLWLLVLAKPFFTLLIAAPVSLYGLLPDFGGEQEIVALQTVQLVQPVSTAGASVVIAAEDLHGYGFIGLIWLGVTAVLVLRLFVGQGYVWLLRRRSRLVADGPLHVLLQQIFADIGLRRSVRVALSDDVPGPLLMGFLRPLILLPRKIEQEFSAAQVKLIIVHEIEHMRRYDNLVLLVQRLVETVLFFHPVAWLSGRNLRREAEKACDDSVLRRYSNPVEYADSLTRIAEMRGGFQFGLLVHTFARAESQLVQRVRRILSGRTTSRRVGPKLAVFLLLTVGCIGLPRHIGSAEKERDVEVVVVRAFADSALGAVSDTVTRTMVKKIVVSRDGVLPERKIVVSRGDVPDSLMDEWKEADVHLIDVSGGIIRSIGPGIVEDHTHNKIIDVTALPDRFFEVTAAADTLAMGQGHIQHEVFLPGLSGATDSLTKYTLKVIKSRNPRDSAMAHYHHASSEPLNSLNIILGDGGEIAKSYSFPVENETPISFNVPSKGKVQLGIYDHKDHRVRVMLDAVMEPGDYKLFWDGLDDLGKPVEDGSYFYKIGVGMEITHYPIEPKNE